MISRWRELSGGMKVFYFAGMVSASRLGVMILSGLTSVGDILLSSESLVWFVQNQ